MLQRPGIEPKSGVEACVLYCQRHSIPANRQNPEHMRPQVASQLLSRWKLEMAKRFKHLEWSKKYRKRHWLRLKGKEEARHNKKV